MEELKTDLHLKQKINEKEIVLLLVKSKNCSVCEAVFVQLEDFISHFNNLSGYYVSIDTIPTVASDYLIFTAPTVLLFINGKEIERQSRFISYDKFRVQIERYSEL